jgi:hypothetical protein
VIGSVSPDTGPSSTDHITSATAITLSGTAEANSTVAVRDGTRTVGTAVVSNSGTWSIKDGGASFTAGIHTYTATDKDAAGNVSKASSAFVVTDDRTAPCAPKISTISPDRGSSSTDHLTNATTLTITGSGAEASTVVTLFDGATALGTSSADASGNWGFTTNTLTSGSHKFTARDTDVAGNVSAASSAVTITIDTTAPNPVIANITATNAGLNLSGTSDASSSLKIYDGTTVLGTTAASSSGTWSFSATNKQAPNNLVNNFTATATDSAGNIGAGYAEWGTTGNDTLASTSGNDTMWGRTGADTFAFGLNFGHDTIKDFTPSQHDIIQFNQALFTNFAAMMKHTQQVGANTVITDTAGDTLTLTNVTASTLQSNNFKFV